MYLITLMDLRLFKDIPKSTIVSLFEKIDYHVNSYDKGDYIAKAGSRLMGLSIVVEGSVRGEMLDYSGKKMKIEDIASPNILAPAFLFSNGSTIPVDVVANESAKILFISKEQFLTLMSSDSKILNNFLNIVSSRSQFLTEKIKFLSFKTIREKFMHYIMMISRQSGRSEIELPQSQEKVAELFGVTRSALAKVISELNEDGVIISRNRKVTILKK